jgi:hypothetical protein
MGKRGGAVKVLFALALVYGALVTEHVFQDFTLDRAAHGCELVKEANGGRAVLVKVQNNPPTYETQFVNGTVRWECG